MWGFKIIFLILSFVVFLEAKTYYFSFNKTTKEYIIQSRYNVNNSLNASQPAVHLGELRNNVTRKKNLHVIQTHSLLDHEWDYNWKNLSRPKLPIFIQNFYDSFGLNISGPVRFLFNTKPLNSTIVHFNISEIDPSEEITEVELHFFLRIDKELLEKSLILRLYQIDDKYINESSLINPDSHKLLNVIYVYKAENGWQIFKLTNALVTFLENRTDLSLFITVSKPNQEQFHLFKDGNKDSFRTFVMLKSGPLYSETVDDEKVESSGFCRKHELYVNFKKLNWMRFIISPVGYQAYNCYGACNRHDHNLPNHLKVTSFFPEIAKKPVCCSPVRYAPLPIMFFDRRGNVAIKSYPEMVISDCGCR